MNSNKGARGPVFDLGQRNRPAVDLEGGNADQHRITPLLQGRAARLHELEADNELIRVLTAAITKIQKTSFTAQVKVSSARVPAAIYENF